LFEPSRPVLTCRALGEEIDDKSILGVATPGIVPRMRCAALCGVVRR
jgi:hypothetical protein